MAKQLEELQLQLQAELEVYKNKHKETKRLQTMRAQLDAQNNELTAVETEFNLLDEDTEVFKLVGPVLLKQSQIEAKETIRKRKMFIDDEVKKTEDALAKVDKVISEQREKLTNLQKRIQELSMQTATAES